MRYQEKERKKEEHAEEPQRIYKVGKRRDGDGPVGEEAEPIDNV